MAGQKWHWLRFSGLTGAPGGGEALKRRSTAHTGVHGTPGHYLFEDRFGRPGRGNGAIAVIPPRSNRRKPHSYDEYLYREHHLVECFIGKIKHYRHIFSRFDKLAHNRYLGFLHFVGALIWLR